MEGGARDKVAEYDPNFDPFKHVQSPFAEGEPIEDTRIKDMFKKQMKIDLIFVRFIIIAGNIFLLVTDYIHKTINQLRIQAMEGILISVLMMGL